MNCDEKATRRGAPTRLDFIGVANFLAILGETHQALSTKQGRAPWDAEISREVSKHSYFKGKGNKGRSLSDDTIRTRYLRQLRTLSRDLRSGRATEFQRLVHMVAFTIRS